MILEQYRLKDFGKLTKRVDLIHSMVSKELTPSAKRFIFQGILKI